MKLQLLLRFQMLELLPGLLIELGALAGLCADVQQADSRILDAQHQFGIVGAHHGELYQLFHGAFAVGTSVDQYGPPPARGQAGSHGGPLDASDTPHQQGGSAEQSAGASGGDKGVPAAGLQQLQTDGHGGIRLFPPDDGWIVAVVHHFGAVDDLHPGGQLIIAILFHHMADGCFVSGEQHFYAEFLRRL